MKKNALLISILLFFVLLSSCEDDKKTKDPYLTGIYVVNYGNYSGSKSTITSYDEMADTVYQDVYQNANGVEILSNVQYAAVHNGNIYMMSNDGDKIDIVGAQTFKALVNPIGNEITKPRYIVFDNNIAYVSCWGNVLDWSKLNNSYIAKINLETRQVEKILALPGGPEGMAIAAGKLFIALNYRDSIAVMNLDKEEFSYIATPAVSSYFLKDQNENLYVSLVSTYSNPSTESGIGYINTENNTLVSNYKLDGITSNYGSIMQFNKDESKIYIIASSWVQEGSDWVLKGAVNTFDISIKTFDAEPFLSGLTGINGITVNQKNDLVYCFIAESAIAEGKMEIYNASAEILSTQKTGLSPIMSFFTE